MNEFLKCHIEKVSIDGSKARGGNCDTGLELNKSKRHSLYFVLQFIYTVVLIKAKAVDKNRG